MDVTDGLRQLEAADEVPVGVLPQLPIRAHHAKVVVGDGASAVVADGLEGEERLLIVGQGLGQRALNVGEDAEVLLDAAAELGAPATQRQRLVEPLPRGVDGPALEVEPGEGVDRLGRKHGVAVPRGHGLAPKAQLPGRRRLVVQMVQHPAPPQGFSQDRAVGIFFRTPNGFVVARERLEDRAGALVAPRVPQQSASAGRPGVLGRPALGERRGV